ncbi:MAG: sugar transferase [Actinomycetota bacterium]
MSIQEVDPSLRDALTRARPDGRAPADIRVVHGAEPPAGPAIAPTPPSRWWTRRAVAIDVVVALATVMLAEALRFGTVVPVDQPISYRVVGPLIAIVWMVALVCCGAYDRKAFLFGVEEARAIVKASVALLATVGVVFFLLRIGLSRGFLGAYIPAVLVFTALGRWPLRAAFRRRQRAGIGQRQAVVVGPAAEVDRLVASLTRRPGAVAAAAVVTNDGADAALGDLRARLEDLAGIGAYDLIMRAGHPTDEETWTLADLAGHLGVDFAIAPSHASDANLVFSYVPLGTTPILLVEPLALRPEQRVIKAIADCVLGVAALVVALPLMAVVALTVLVREGRPILFSQERVGLRGERFRIRKFRTMTVDAEARRCEVEDANEASGPLFKIRSDPRVTPLGAFLRRWSLDELPQLFQVVTGRMSLVGPRPPLPSEVATYDERVARRLLVKPGLTGLWQVDGRSNLPWDEGVYLDVMYVDHWSPLLDAAILARTVRAVLRRDGAY